MSPFLNASFTSSGATSITFTALSYVLPDTLANAPSSELFSRSFLSDTTDFTADLAGSPRFMRSVISSCSASGSFVTSYPALIDSSSLRTASITASGALSNIVAACSYVLCPTPAISESTSRASLPADFSGMFVKSVRVPCRFLASAFTASSHFRTISIL